MQTVKLRSAHQLQHMNGELVKELVRLTRSRKLEIPIIYQYSQKIDQPLDPSQECNIGYVKNIWLDSQGDLYCDVVIFCANAASQEFDNVIDNISAKIIPDKNKIMIDAFIIYNREAKRMIRETHRQKAIIKETKKSTMGQKMAKEGSIPLTNDTDVTDMVEISKQLAKQFEQEIAEKEENN